MKNIRKDIWNIEEVIKIMEEAHKEAEKAVCLKKKVGSVIVNKITGEIVGRGFGGAKDPCKICVRKQYEWQQDGCWAVHSELKALFNYFKAYGYKRDLRNYILFVTHGPCDQCIKYCYEFNITFMVYDISYHNDYSKWAGKVDVHRLDTPHKKIIWENPKIKKR